MPDPIGQPTEINETKYNSAIMKKTRYTAPAAEWLEADNAYCFLQESPTGDIPELEDGGWSEIW